LWLQSLGLRPHWALHFIVHDRVVHFYPHGHLFASYQDVKPFVPACGRHPMSFGPVDRLPLHRGLWTESRSVCRECADAAADHPETYLRDLYDPLPAPVFDPALSNWRDSQSQIVQTSLLANEDANTITEHLL
jgi:hypothetical protein